MKGHQMRLATMKVLCFALIGLVHVGLRGADSQLDETLNSKKDSDIYIDLIFTSLGSVEYRDSPDVVRAVASTIQKSHKDSIKSEIWNGKIQDYVRRNHAAVLPTRTVDNLLDLMEYGAMDEKRTAAFLLELMHDNAKAFIPDHAIWRKWIGDNRQRQREVK